MTDHCCFVTVVIAVYNQNSTLKIVLDLLERQDYEGLWEIIVCDDGSDVDTSRIVKDAAQSLSRSIRYVWQPRNGWRLAKSRNNALRCANGHIIILMDGDLAVRPDFVSRHVASHSDERTAVFGTRRWLFLGDLPREVPIERVVELLLFREADISALYSETWLQEKYTRSAHPWLACMGCNFSFVQGVDSILFDEKFVGWGGEDQEFACRLHVRYGYNLRFVPSIVGLHLDRGCRRSFVSVRPKSHSEIVQYFRNIAYFCDCYPELDMIPACMGLGHFQLDPESNTWGMATRPNFDRTHIHSLLVAVRDWLQATS